ncbi:hypothetical protein FNQ90_13270 [Streptomyces alkaliphilus]|uniref:Uncharacterized protein n=1 Tax=Streptomyces alkaliphilus TaxID=1472722 RepID=A0A7W3Y286_9ACTN|nr:hypothetical protein [Streptomyces alkaliphilus]MBB0245052.1 hypothetical protein [Streptomyces alkaliphilus]
MAHIITRQNRRTSPAATANTAPECCGVPMTYRTGRWECDHCYGWQTAATPGTLGLLLAVTAAGLLAAALTGPGRRTVRAARRQGTTTEQSMWCSRCGYDTPGAFSCHYCGTNR